MRRDRREARLRLDLKLLEKLARESSLISFEAAGDPPERYIVRYRCKGLGSAHPGDVVSDHKVEITLGAQYPSRPPLLVWKTRIFHPNIVPPYVCVLGEAWKAKKTLDELVVQLGEMIQYKNYNVHDPLDEAAANWASQNPRPFPVDNRPLRDRVRDVP
jgi:ubiquitin-protein ligase